MDRIEQLQREYLKLLEYGREKEMIPLIEEALSLANESKDVVKEIEILNDYSGALRNTGRLLDSIASVEKALDLYKKKYGSKSSDSYITMLINLANSYRQAGEIEKSMSTFKVIRHSIKDISPYSQASYYNNFSLLYFDMMEYEQSIVLQEQSVEILKSIGNEIQLAIGYGNLADMYYMVGNYEKSISLLKKSENILSKKVSIKHPLYIKNLNSLAVLLAKNKDEDKAMSLFRISKEIIKTSHGEDSEAYITINQNILELESRLETYKTGLEESKIFFKTEVLPLFERELEHILNYACFGLVGMGSECLGYDDKLSRDHDFLTRCILFLPLEKLIVYEEEIRQKTKNLDGSLEITSIEEFYKYFTLFEKGPLTNKEFLKVPQDFLRVATNGEVFLDNYGEFSRIRNRLLDYYPEDVKIKKMAYCLNQIAQSGQYNYMRSIKRKDYIAATIALSEFIKYYSEFVHLANKTYMPYYKWYKRSLSELEILGKDSLIKIEKLILLSDDKNYMEKNKIIEEMCQDIVTLLNREGLSKSKIDFLTYQAEEIVKKIKDPNLRMEDTWLI